MEQFVLNQSRQIKNWASPQKNVDEKALKKDGKVRCSLSGFVLQPGLCSGGGAELCFVPLSSFWQELYLFRRLVHLPKD